MVARRYFHSEPTSRLAIWAFRIAVFALVAAFLAVIIVRSGMLEIKPALATFAGALAIAIVALLVAFAAFAVIWIEGLAGMRAGAPEAEKDALGQRGVLAEALADAAE